MDAIVKSRVNRRSDERTYGLFPVTVRSTDNHGRHIKFSTITDNISAGGLFMQLPYLLVPDTPLFAFVQLPNNAGMAALGRVVRTEKRSYGLSGIAVCFIKSRLMNIPIHKSVFPR